MAIKTLDVSDVLIKINNLLMKGDQGYDILYPISLFYRTTNPHITQ